MVPRYPRGTASRVLSVAAIVSRPPDSPAPPDLPVVTPAAPVPVYDCHVIISGPDAEGRLTGRVTTLPGLTATARSERELLIQLVREFQKALQRYRSEGRPIPEIERPDAPGPGERQRWVPVHL